MTNKCLAALRVGTPDRQPCQYGGTIQRRLEHRAGLGQIADGPFFGFGPGSRQLRSPKLCLAPSGDVAQRDQQ
jgi:hypothetical protein